jgi:hypothetical protein
MALTLTRRKLDEIAYRARAEAGYRPAAPSDGLASITVLLAETDIELRRRADDEHRPRLTQSG